MKELKVFRMRPAVKIALGFLGIILLGSIVLIMPVSHQQNVKLSFLDAMFTSVSAVCVTGLAVVETGEYFSTFGQSVVLFLIQIGGLGFMTATSIIFMALKKKFTLKDRMVMQESFNEHKLQGVVRMTRSAIFITLVCEGIGALVLMTRMVPMFGFGKGAFYSVFHSVSAFCNAGFDLFAAGSLQPFKSDPVVLITIMFLIIMGGLGFFVITNFYEWIKTRRHIKLTLQTKIVLSSTMILLVSGCAIFTLLEWNNPETMQNFTPSEKIVNGMFQSVTSRTAGFASVPQGGLESISKTFTVLLMFIGASPSGTGGGIKTTTCAVFFMLLWSTILGRDEVSIYKRRLSHHLVLRAFAILMLGLLFVGSMCIAIMAIESDVNPQDIIFEVVSAFATVGLSTGITAALFPASKILLMVVMFMGRVGLLALIVSLAKRLAKNKGNVRYPEERIMLG